MTASGKIHVEIEITVQYSLHEFVYQSSLVSVPVLNTEQQLMGKNVVGIQCKMMTSGMLDSSRSPSGC